MRSPGHYHLQNRAYFLASNFRHCMIIVSINYPLSLSLSLKQTIIVLSNLFLRNVIGKKYLYRI